MKIPSSLVDKESNTTISDMRTQWASPRVTQVTVLPLHRLRNSLPSQLQKAHLSACEGSPRGATPTPPHLTLHNSLLHSVPPPACPKPLLWHWHLKHTQYRCSVPVRCAKIQRKCQLTSRKHWREVFWERSAASILHFIEDINTNPPPDVPLFPGFPVRTHTSF